MPEARNLVLSEDLAGAVDRAAVQAFMPRSGVLNLQTCLDVLDRRSDKTDGPASQHTSDTVTDRWKLCFLSLATCPDRSGLGSTPRLDDMLVQ